MRPDGEMHTQGVVTGAMHTSRGATYTGVGDVHSADSDSTWSCVSRNAE